MLLEIEGYEIANFFCREKHLHGGVGIYVRKGITYTKIETSSIEKQFECTAISCNTKHKLVIITLYRSPDANLDVFLNKLNETLSSISDKCKKSQILLCGDFNVDFLQSSKEVDNLLDLLLSYNIKPVIKAPTRKTKCLDNICVNFGEDIYEAKTIKNGIGDHDIAQTIHIKLSDEKIRNKKIIYRETHKDENINFFLNLLAQETWNDVFNCIGDANNKYNIFIQILKYYFNMAFPVKTKTISNNGKKTKPWLTRGLIVSGKRLKELHALHSNNEQLNNYYKQYKNIYRKLLNQAKKMYNSDLLMNANNKSKAAWTLIKPNKKMNDSTIILKVNNVNVSSPKEVAEEFSKYFNTVPDLLNKDVLRITGELTLKNMNPRTFFFHPAIETDIIEIVKNLKNSNSVGEDHISTNILKKCAHLVVSPFVHIINCSLSEGIFPDKLKIAKIKPIYKSGDQTEIKNFRPISLLSPFAKVFEKYVSNSIMAFFNSCELFSNQQFGFRKGFSTSSAITELLNSMYESIDNGNKTLGFFLDLSKAFDLVSHNILLNKLERYGLRGLSWQWFTSYLTNRKHYVEIENQKSHELPCSIGVPQGSILGPLLYIIYVNDFPNNNCIMYADDTSLLVSSNTVQSSIQKANVEVKDAISWFVSNNLILNETKSVFMRFHLSRKKIDHSLLVKTTKKSLQQVQSTKFLGINISENCNWQLQIDVICKKIAPMCYCLYQLRSTVERSVLLTYYHAQLQSIISYGILAWGCSHECRRIFVLQKRAIRCIVGANKRTSCKQLFRVLGILTVSCIYIYQLLLYVRNNLNDFKALNSSNYSTRNNLLEIPSHRLTTTEHSPKFMGIRVYNKLPDNIKNLSIQRFKQTVKYFLISKAFYSLEEYFTASF